MKIRLESMDGQLIPHEICDGEEEWDPKFVTHISPSVMEAYKAWRQQGAVFDALFTALLNESFSRNEECPSPGCKGKIRHLVCDECKSA